MHIVCPKVCLYPNKANNRLKHLIVLSLFDPLIRGATVSTLKSLRILIKQTTGCFGLEAVIKVELLETWHRKTIAKESVTKSSGTRFANILCAPIQIWLFFYGK